MSTSATISVVSIDLIDIKLFSTFSLTKLWCISIYFVFPRFATFRLSQNITGAWLFSWNSIAKFCYHTPSQLLAAKIICSASAVDKVTVGSYCRINTYFVTDLCHWPNQKSTSSFYFLHVNIRVIRQFPRKYLNTPMTFSEISVESVEVVDYKIQIRSDCTGCIRMLQFAFRYAMLFITCLSLLFWGHIFQHPSVCMDRRFSRVTILNIETLQTLLSLSLLTSL